MSIYLLCVISALRNGSVELLGVVPVELGEADLRGTTVRTRIQERPLDVTKVTNYAVKAAVVK